MTKEKKISQGVDFLHNTSSGTKIVNQLVMFAILGILPLIFPRLVFLENKNSVFINLLFALITSIIYEGLINFLERKNKSFQWVINLQLFTSVILLTWFLHVFGRINGPFFVLYLLTIMESFLHQNMALSKTIVTIMISSTAIEFFWLIFKREIVLNFVSLLELSFRIISIVFIKQYGHVLAEKINAEEKAKVRIQKTARKLKQTTEALKKTNQRLKRVSALKDEFVSLTSHELRTPLTAIGGSLSTILEGYAGKLSQEAKEFLEGAYNESQRLLRLVSNLLNISRIEAGRLKYEITNFNLLKIIQEAVDSLGGQAKEKGIDLVFGAMDKPLVKADQDKVREVLVNLIGNAIKFIDQGRVAVSCWRQGNQVLAAVEDSGPGIASQDQKKLFRKFERVVGQRDKDKKGTGLGLYICQTLIKGMGGEIWLKSVSGKGTVFFLTLPAASSRFSPAGQKDSA